MTKGQAEMYCRTVQGHPTSCVVCRTRYNGGVPEIPLQKRDGDWAPVAVCSEPCLEEWQREHGVSRGGRER